MRKLEDPVVKEIVELYEEGNFRGILTKIRHVVQTGDKTVISGLHSLSWPAPTEPDLEFFSNLVHERNIAHMYSIGCGTGLLEWLISRSLQERSSSNPVTPFVTGVEIDVGWWGSDYSPPMFLPLLFVDKDFNCSEPFGNDHDIALFCYFNNLAVFLDYLGVFRGKYIAILGPISNTQFCAPAPLELVENPEMPCADWKLLAFRPFGLGGVDHLAVYEKVA